MNPAIEVRNLSKEFTLHTQGGTVLPVFRDLDLTVSPGECVVLGGPSGVGKSTLIRCMYANYRPTGGTIAVRHDGRPADIVSAPPRLVIDVRRRTLGYVSQFLRTIPRVPALDIVAEPLRAVGVEAAEARARAAELLRRLRIPERLFGLPPATFSGGEQQRVNIARGFAHPYPILLLDEPTASLDAANRETVVGLVREALDRGAAIVAILHDQDARDAVATRLFDLSPYSAM